MSDSETILQIVEKRNRIILAVINATFDWRLGQITAEQAVRQISAVLYENYAPEDT